MVMARKADDLELRCMAFFCLVATAALGLAFLVVKGFEYRQDFAEHLFPGQDFRLPEPAAQIFFSFYREIPAIHALHLTIGIAPVSRLAWLLRRGGTSTRSPKFEVVSLYWGFVDMVSIMVFSLIYLGGGRS